MLIYEPKCCVCGAPLSKYAIFQKDIRNSEVCSAKCFEKLMSEDGIIEECEYCGYKHLKENCPFAKRKRN